MIKLYRTWEKVKDLFVKPSLKVYFGKWKNDPNLPIWRTGPTIHLCKSRSVCLPRWMRFYIVNEDVGWKTKWENEIRYEYPPQFSIIACGIWRRIGDEGRTEYFSVRPEFVIQDKQEEYYAATSEIKAKYINRTIV